MKFLELLRLPIMELKWISVNLLERITMLDAVKKYSGIDFNEVNTLDEARELAKNIMLNLKCVIQKVIY